MSTTTLTPAGTATSCSSCGRPTAPRTSPRPGVARAGSRGLCTTCERSARDHGTIEDHPRPTRCRFVVADDYRTLIESRAATTRVQAAQRLGMTLDALDRALYRAGVDLAAVPRTGARPAGWGRR